MAYKKINLAELAEKWDALRTELKRFRRINAELFDEAFSQTYSLLCKKSAETTIDRKLVEVIALAYLFANTEIKELDCKYRATLALTERMIHCCGLNPAPAAAEGTLVYLFEAHKEVYLNFKDIDGSVERLETLFKREAWECI